MLFSKLLLAVLPAATLVQACTNILVSPGASSDGTMIAYNSDDADGYGALLHLAAADHPPGSRRTITDWDSGEVLGSIPEANHTYNVVGNMNEHELVIGETTFGGIDPLQAQKGAIMDYGSLIWITLQRATTAREAIQMFADLTTEYGYSSGGETFSIGDPTEAWIVDLIGKGDFEKGAVWVATRIPDGHVSGAANQARTTTFVAEAAANPEGVLYSPDAVTFARVHLNYTGTDEAFDFSAAYDPITTFGARLCDARVWSFFREVADGMDAYLPYLQGLDMTNRLPLTVPLGKGKKKLDVNDTMWHLRSHNTGTWFDATKDVGAAAFHAPQRWRPLMWQVGPGGVAPTPKSPTYVHERTVGYHVTMWHFVAQARTGYPAPIGGLLWFGVDDASTSAHVPFYCGATAIPDSWAIPRTLLDSTDQTYNGDVTVFDWDAAWWAFNVVANYAYDRWETVYPFVAAAIKQSEADALEAVAALDAALLKRWAAGDTEGAIEQATAFGINGGNAMVKQWQALFGQLFARFRDGGVTTKVSIAANPSCACAWSETGYDTKWYERIVADTGSHYLLGQAPTAADLRKLKVARGL